MSTDDPVIEADGIARSVAAERLAQFMSRERVTSLSAVAPGLYLAWMLRPEISTERLTCWFTVLCAVNAVALTMAVRFRRRTLTPRQQSFWRQRQLGLRWASALTWGAAATLMPLDASEALTAKLGMVLVGVSAVSALGLIPAGFGSFLITISLWILPIGTLIRRDADDAYVLILGVLIMNISLNFFFWQATNQLRQGIEKRFEAAALADSLRLAAERIRTLATHDELTGTFNRRYGMELLQHWCENEMNRSGSGPEGSGQLHALLLDVDHFKRVNDTHGHLAGDAVLREVSSRLQSQLRVTDVLARFGGEEFLIIVPQTAPSAVMGLADRLRMAVASAPIIVNEDKVTVTVSLGVANVLWEEGVEHALSRADDALYAAKRRGRNHVVQALETSPPRATELAG